VAQTPRTLTPHASGWRFLGAELRCWRQRQSVSLAQLARAVYVSPDLLAKIEKADRTPSLDIIGRCDEALNTGGALGRLWRFVEQQAATQAPEPLPLTSPVVFKVITEVVASGVAEPQSAPTALTHGKTRLYSLPGGRVR
jgi:transcriptional regulator with XRE-family HTH domain